MGRYSRRFQFTYPNSGGRRGSIPFESRTERSIALPYLRELTDSLKHGGGVGRSTDAWLRKLDDLTYYKLAKVGLVPYRRCYPAQRWEFHN